MDAAHTEGFRIILDIIFNHSGSNWLYPENTPAAQADIPGKFKAKYQDGRYNFGAFSSLQEPSGYPDIATKINPFDHDMHTDF